MKTHRSYKRQNVFENFLNYACKISEYVKNVLYEDEKLIINEKLVYKK